MVAPVLSPSTSPADRRVLLPGRYDWAQFEAIASALRDALGLRVTYLDGYIELMPLSERHEAIGRFLSFLLQLYFFENGIEYVPVGSATRSSRDREVSFEPDESYYVGIAPNERNDPNLAIEMVLTSGSLDKLQKYQRFAIEEVWFWEGDRLSVYCLKNKRYEPSDRSVLLPDLDLDLLSRCVQMESKLAAVDAFRAAIGGSD